MGGALRLVVLTALLGALAWSAAALWIDGPPQRWLAGALALGTVLASLALWMRFRSGWGLLLAFIPFLGVLGWWLWLPPSNDRDWMPDVARPSEAEFAGNRVTIRNVRDFRYGATDADFTERWETRSYDLDGVRGLDIYFSYWGPTLYAHTIMSWEFSDGRHLAISIETRKEKGESYSALLGFFRQYELYYVVADERDLIGVRASQRGEQLFLYRLRMPPERARALLVGYLEVVNRLARTPRWYNALRHNCTTLIAAHIDALAPGEIPWDWRLLANGYLDQFAYERGATNRDLPFEELKRQSDVTARARAAGADPDFSRLIREGLPERPAPALP